jgi:hypothetical protein
MYAPQSNIPSATKYFLDALNTGEAQLKTADGADTVFAQKMQQGIAQGVPQTQGMQGAKQDYAAAAPSVMQNQKQAEVQRMVQQAMQPQPVGIEQLPAQNMQGMQKMAEGGVVGYNGESESEVKQQVSEILRKAPAARSPQENAVLRAAGVELEQRAPGEGSGVMALDKYLSSPFIREAITGGAHKLSDEELRKRSDAGGITESIFRAFGGNRSVNEAPPQAMRPEDAFASPRIDQPQRIATPSAPPIAPEAQQLMDRQRSSIQRPPAPRPPAPAPVPTAAPIAPQSGIASLPARPAYDTASIAAAGVPYITTGEGDVGKLRAAEGKRAEFEKTLPDLSAKGIEALRQRMTDVEAAEASRKGRLGSDRVIQQLLGRAQGSGGAARADIQFMNAQRAAEDAFSQARLGNQQAQLLMEKAQQERQLGRFDRAIALEKDASALMEKARDNALRAQQIAQGVATAQFQGATQQRGQEIESQTAAEQRKVQIRGQDITERTAAADRAAQAALRNLPTVEQKMAERVMNDWLAKNPGKTLADAWDFYRGAGKGLDQRAESAAEANRLKRQKLISDDPSYKMARFDLYQSTDPAKKADAQRRIKEIERDAGIVDDGASAAPSQTAPAVGTVMQGFRFKGGNPADKNNWEKV